MNGSADPELVFEEDSGPFLEAAEEFVRREISDNLERWCEESAIPAEFFRKAGDTGLLAVLIPREVRGLFTTVLRSKQQRRTRGVVPIRTSQLTRKTLR